MNEIAGLVVAYEGDVDRAINLLCEQVLLLQHADRIEGHQILATMFYLTEVLRMEIPRADQAIPCATFIEGMASLLHYSLHNPESLPTGFQIWSATFNAQLAAYGVTIDNLTTILERREEMPQ